MKNRILCFLCFFFLGLIHCSYAEEGPRVEQFSPQGTVKGIRQVLVCFSEPMVPFGDPRILGEPFAIKCSPKGTGQWVDSKNWAFDFEKDLPAGVRCEFTLKPALQSLSGKEIVGQKDFSFSTGGPAIQRSIPDEGTEYIDEEQVFILTLDGEPDRGSVLTSVTFSIEGLQDRVGVRVIEGKEREQILKTESRRTPGNPILLVQSKQRFPSAAKISLVWGKGVRSNTGEETERDQILRFQTRKAFHAELRCERENPNAGCIPIKPFTLSFSAPIAKNQAHKIRLEGPGGKIWKPLLDEREDIMKVAFKGPFPEKSKFSIELPPRLTDDAGRPLINADKFPLVVQTDHYPPLAKFSSRFGILESKIEPVLPVTVRNLEPSIKAKMVKLGPEEDLGAKLTGKILNVPPQKGDEIQGWLRRVASASRETSLFGPEQAVQGFTIPKPTGSQAFELVGIPLKGPGLYVVELESALLGAALLHPPKPMFVPAAVLVTNLSVHFKWGNESSLVWVTSMDQGEPVPGAAVTIRDCRENILWTGTTNADGLARIAAALPSGNELSRCEYTTEEYDSAQMGALRSLDHGLFITAQTSDDLAFVHSSWDQGIEPWRFQLPGEGYRGPIVAHTIFDRTLLRAGEAVHMKHILRQKTLKGFSVPAPNRRPDSIAITHYGSDLKYEFPLNWDGRGVAETTWKIPREAKLGI
ncbi:MAG: MG2 domain-containing protein, partial [Deltaproteobacteria bacterium]|nr:MG2 domain-containing protein [Deltaproteobacteria bacterium]